MLSKNQMPAGAGAQEYFEVCEEAVLGLNVLFGAGIDQVLGPGSGMALPF